MQQQWWFRMGRVMERCQGRGLQWSTTTHNSGRRWWLLPRTLPERRRKRGAKIFFVQLPESFLVAGSTYQSRLSECGWEKPMDLTIEVRLTTGRTQIESDSKEHCRCLINRFPSLLVTVHSRILVIVDSGVLGWCSRGYKDWARTKQVSRQNNCHQPREELVINDDSLMYTYKELPKERNANHLFTKKHFVKPPTGWLRWLVPWSLDTQSFFNYWCPSTEGQGWQR